MANEQSLLDLRKSADRALDQLAGLDAEAALPDAKRLVVDLRDGREYERMARLAEAISRIDSKDPTNRRLYAQALIELGKGTAAIDVLQVLIRRLPKNHPESAEAGGLLGRAYKQIFFDAKDKSSASARQALKQAIAAYRKPFEENPANVWHGVNLVALLINCRRLGIRVASELNPRELAAGLVTSLESRAAENGDQWHLAALAEAYLAVDDWDAVVHNVHAFAAKPDAKAFVIASTLRQLTQIWNLEESERGRDLVNVLRVRLLQLPGGEVRFEPGDLQRLQEQPMPSEPKLEAILGRHGAETFKWWKMGLKRAESVASIRQRLGGRVGTGLLVRAGDLGAAPADDLVVLTNFHVVNEHGVSPGIRPEDAEIVFEAIDPETAYVVDKVLWSSPPEQCDASILRLTTPVTGIEPLPIARSLPTLEETTQVYVVGYPGGRELSFSFQDNKLLDHEGPPGGQPQIPGISRVHYTAPTEGGSSGSPVFNSRLWQVIALHHKGGKVGMPRLNGVAGTYGANEGISIQSIVAFAKS